jgi:hypothetical protein
MLKVDRMGDEVKRGPPAGGRGRRRFSGWRRNGPEVSILLSDLIHHVSFTILHTEICLASALSGEYSGKPCETEYLPGLYRNVRSA